MPRNQDVETWETTTNSVVSVNLYDARGAERSKVAGGRAGQRVQLTTAEREELNEDLAVDETVCIFRNGTLRPVKNVPDDVVARFQTETKAHGGHSVEELLEALETRKGDDFRTWVRQLNEATLRRLAEMAQAADATASQLGAIDEALERYAVTGPEGSAARMTEADKILHADPKTPGAPAKA